MQQKYKACRKCGQKKILSGRNAEHNAKDASGSLVCPDCVIEEFYERFNK